jgi:hypothetical protein
MKAPVIVLFAIASLAHASQKLYEKIFGGSFAAGANAIAVDGAGEAWIGGSTGSVDFPLVNAIETTLGARPIWQSTNSGVTWTPIDNLPFALPQVMVVDPSNPTTLYEATQDLGVFKSTNGGATWTQSSTGISDAYVQALAIDPVHTQTLYAATATTIYKSTNGAASWTAIDTQLVTQIEVDGQRRGPSSARKQSRMSLRARAINSTPRSTVVKTVR